MGAVTPFSFSEDLELVLDLKVLAGDGVAFNFGVLDRSVFMSVDDYLALATPQLAEISVSDCADSTREGLEKPDSLVAGAV